MINKGWISRINVFLFVVTFALRSYTDAVYEANGLHGGLIENLKYMTAFAGIAFCIIQLCIRNKNMTSGDNTRFFIREVYVVIVAIWCMVVLSILETLIHPMGVDAFSESISEFFKLILPIVYAYLVLNTFDFTDIYNSMALILFFSMAGYVIEIGVDTFTIDNVMKMNFASSYSPFESHYAAGSAIAMCTFFMYYRKNKVLEIIGFIFAIATFKRAAVVFAIVCFFMPLIFDMRKPVKKRTINLIKVGFVAVTYIYYYLLQPENSETFRKVFNESQEFFTMGRSTYISRLIHGDFVSTGFGSTTVFIGKSIEMDLIKIMLELTIVGLIIFVWCYFDCAGKARYSVLYMCFVFINLLSSHSLTNAFSWILTFVIIGTMNYKEPADISAYVKRKAYHNDYFNEM